MDWLTRIKSAEKTSINRNGTRKIHYKFPDGEEMAEEYNMETNILTRRAWKQNNNLTKNDDWLVEVGDPAPRPIIMDHIGIQEHANAPYLNKRLTKQNIEWRIRNLPYPIETYKVDASPEDKSIVVRTNNKKYYKKIHVPELDRCGILPEQKYISYVHRFNTLIITYKKPEQVLKMEADILEELKNVKTIEENELPSCNQS